MGQLNLYKIDDRKHQKFTSDLKEKFISVGPEKVIDQTESQCLLSFFIENEDKTNPVEWNWLLRYFENPEVTSRSNPKGILVVKTSNEMYACTYGFSFFMVDKYCDTDFAFDFARRVKYKEIKTTMLLSPNSKRNKVVNTYLDYSNLEFDSGESFAKLKVKMDLPQDFKLFKPGIEVGHSIKFEIQNDSIDAIIQVLRYVKNRLAGVEIYKIPVFNKVSDKALITQLDEQLAHKLEDSPLSINLSELDIIGVTEIFNNYDTSFKIKYQRKSKELSQLSSEEITQFIQNNDIPLSQGLKKIKIISSYNGASVRTDVLYDLIDYIDDDQRCVLSKGKWYHFNDDYLNYLTESLAEIDTIYEPAYDYNSTLYEQFISSQYTQDKERDEYKNLDAETVKNKLRKKYYRERAYNLYVSQQFGFDCHDREETRIKESKVELMDLYKDETIFAVKFGNASSVLCYCVDQSISTLKIYKHQLSEELPDVRKFCVWFLLERSNQLEYVDGKPDINKLEMLMLKNKLDAWKKEVRVLGYTPIIRINYFN